ncbi:hypothetical protein ACFQZX_03850 [Mucilaginibacter litoreus]|uniref:DUF2157 domain-containing protein n=1 Tax=Mucilaginibacter litoreus TaxID=1048221 RepID=A0ABW3AQG2_9SPHI
MIIYNKEWLYNLRIVKQLQADQEDGYVSKDELNAIKAHYPVGFYLPGIVARIGFFILTLIALLLSSGLLSLIAASGDFIESPIWPLFLGVLCYLGLEWITKNDRYFHSGIDNAFLYYTAILLIVGITWLTNSGQYGGMGFITEFMILLLVAVYLTLRFADVAMAFGSCVSFFCLIYFLWAKLGNFGLTTMPFVMILAAGGVYALLDKIAKSKTDINYWLCLEVAKVTALVTLYFAGNYFVVNKLNNLLHGLNDSNTHVQLGFFFWMWTTMLPLAFIAIGIKKRNRVMLRLGMLLTAVAVATFRNYYHLLPVEFMLTLAGAILLLLAYTLIRYFKTPKHGITYAEPVKATDWDKLNIEGFVIGQTAAQVPNTHTRQQSPFGGGTGGGGGSSDSF